MDTNSTIGDCNNGGVLTLANFSGSSGVDVANVLYPIIRENFSPPIKCRTHNQSGFE